MKKKIFLPLVFSLIGIVLLVGTLLFCLTSLNSPAIMIAAPKEAKVSAQSMLDAIAAGDYETASTYIYGQPSLGASQEPAEQIGQMLWDAYIDSFTYEFSGNCYASLSGVSLNVTVHALDLSSVGTKLSERMDTLMTKRLEQEGDISEIYDKNGNFQESLIQKLLLEAFQQALDQDAQITTQTFALNMTYQNGRWWVVLDQALLQAISGGVTG